MTPGPALACPRCARTLTRDSWVDERHGTCYFCKTEFELMAFPALHAGGATVAARAAVVAADSVCYFHASNRAEAICDECGRLLCPVCSVPFLGRRMCPTCIATARNSSAATLVQNRVLFDGIALALATVPLLMWPITVVTAPAAIGMAIYGWNKPSSLVRGRSRVRLWCALVLGLLQVVAWGIGFFYLLYANG